ncbi:hypothetical protein BGX38DRAFT_815809 [Terfezia claveryi]|nr:hypothetical protein BGX38DRAFT_815809 [Terfezia claveryi]
MLFLTNAQALIHLTLWVIETVSQKSVSVRGSSGCRSMASKAGPFVSPSGQSATSSNGVDKAMSVTTAVAVGLTCFLNLTVAEQVTQKERQARAVRWVESWWSVVTPFSPNWVYRVCVEALCEARIVQHLEPVPAVGSDNDQKRTMQPSLHSYPKWESFCGDTGYSVVLLTGMHPVTSSPRWAAIYTSQPRPHQLQRITVMGIGAAYDPHTRHYTNKMKRPGGLFREGGSRSGICLGNGGGRGYGGCWKVGSRG